MPRAADFVGKTKPEMEGKKLRDDWGYWEQVESYVTKHTEASSSHGICPECLKELHPEYSKEKEPEMSRVLLCAKTHEG